MKTFYSYHIQFCRTAIVSLMAVTCTVLTSCNESEAEVPQPSPVTLNIEVGLDQFPGRAIITGNTLGDNSQIGILLDDGSATDYDAANNVRFTASTVDGKQVWTPDTKVSLTATQGTLYAYYPYAAGTDLSAIEVSTVSQTDYLYAEPIDNVNEDNNTVSLTMKHMLTNVKVNIDRGSYTGEGNISNITIHSDGFATGGTFNAAQETPAFTSTTGTDESFSQNVTTTLGGKSADIMVVPTGTSNPVAVTATIDGKEYVVSTEDITLSGGCSYQYSLVLHNTCLEVSGVSITPWNHVPKEELTLDKDYSI